MEKKEFSELSDAEVSEIRDLYINSSKKVRDIIEMYNINLDHNKLYKCLPPLKTEKKCPYCNSFMTIPIHSRSVKFNYANPTSYTCPKCHHIEDFWKECNCQNCIDAREAQEAKAEKDLREFLISFNSEDKKIAFRSLDFETQLKIILVLTKNNTKCNYTQLYPHINDRNDSCPSYIGEKYISELHEDNLLSLSPYSALSAFTFDTSGTPLEYYANAVSYNVLVDFDSDDFEYLQNNNLSMLFTTDQISAKYKSTIERIAISEFIEICKERKIDLVPSSNTISDLKKLLSKMSLLQFLNMCEREARWFNDQVTTNKCSRREAGFRLGKAVINCCQYWIDHGYTFRDSSRAPYLDNFDMFFLEEVVGVDSDLAFKSGSILEIKDDRAQIKILQEN